MTVLLNSTGQPEPSIETSRRLRALHAGLHLKFLGSGDTFWSVCMTWEPEDPRWATVQSGEISPERAFDIIGYLPMDCDADQAPAYLERMFRTWPAERVRNIANHIDRYNAGVVADAADHALGEVLDATDPSAPRKRGRPKKVR